MENIGLLLGNKWYVVLLSILYCLVMYYLAKETKYKTPVIIYSLVFQIIFLLYFFITGSGLMVPPVSGPNFNGFNRFLSVLSVFFYFFYVPVCLLSLNKLRQRFTTKVVVANFVGMVLLSFVLIHPFLWLTYGFAP